MFFLDMANLGFKVNLFLMQHSEYNRDIWLIKNSNKVSLIPPTESELVIF